MTRNAALASALVLSLALPVATAKKKVEPEHVQVQHILIAFENTLGASRTIPRNEAEARYLAYQLLERARGGEDFASLVREYSDDQYPGIYRMANKGVEVAKGEYSRKRMVAGFGDVAFSLEVGEVGIADFSPESSPYGWHIVKRLE
jgi:parvulin-like peptidyl-prolyl isomerase